MSCCRRLRRFFRRVERRVRRAYDRTERFVRRGSDALHNSTKGWTNKIDQAIGTNMAGHNKGGWLNTVIKTFNTAGYVKDAIEGKNPWKELQKNYTDLARKTGMEMNFKGEQPETPGSASGISGAVAEVADAKTDQASAENKNAAMEMGYGISSEDRANAKRLGALNAGRISEDERANASSLLLAKLKKSNSKSGFSNDFIR